MFHWTVVPVVNTGGWRGELLLTTVVFLTVRETGTQSLLSYILKETGASLKDEEERGITVSQEMK